jgi:hypothetical protein
MTTSKDRIDNIRKRAEARRGTEVRALNTNRDCLTPEKLAEEILEAVEGERDERS